MTVFLAARWLRTTTPFLYEASISLMCSNMEQTVTDWQHGGLKSAMIIQKTQLAHL